MAAVTKRNYSTRDQSLEATGGNLIIPFDPQPVCALNTDRDGWFEMWEWDSSQLMILANTTAFTSGLFNVPQLVSGRITAIVAIVQADVHVSLPAVMPSIRLLGYNIASALVTDVTQVDTSANIGAFDAAHTIVLTASAGASFGNQTFDVLLVSESGANSVANFRVFKLYAVVVPE